MFNQHNHAHHYNKNKGDEKRKFAIQITNKQWQNSFKNVIATTSDTKLRWLQFRILHNILTTNYSVSKFKREQTPLCEFCNLQNETIHHLFWQCEKVKLFWQELQHIINRRCKHSHNFKIDEKLVFLGKSETVKTDKICELILLLAKFYIYRCKVQSNKLSLPLFTKELYTRYSIEKTIHKNSIRFRNNWGPFVNIFKGLM